jgi:hypothetical protein
MITQNSSKSESVYLTLSLKRTVLASIHFVPDFDVLFSHLCAVETNYSGFVGLLPHLFAVCSSYLVSVTFPVRMAP